MAEPLSKAELETTATPLPDATQGLMYDFLERHESIVEGRKALNKQKKELVEAVEKAGIPKASWEHFLKTREEAGVVRERVDAVWRQLHRWDNKPIGVQSGMVFSSASDADLNVHELKRVDLEGHEAGKAGRKRESNPYTPSTEAYQRWDNAWIRGDAEKPAEAAPKSPGRPRGSKNQPGHRAGRPPGGSKSRQPDLQVHDGGAGKPGSDDQVH